jgi:TonB family protein
MLNLHTHDQSSPRPRRKRAAAFGSALAIHATLFAALLVGAQRAHLMSGIPEASGQSSGPLTYVMPVMAAAPPVVQPAQEALPVETKVEPAVEPAAQPSDAAASSAMAAQVAGPVRMGQGDLVLLRKIKPLYPSVMQAARREGVVTLDATIRRDGSIGDVRVLSASTAFFEQAAIAAVKQWRYAPPPFEAIVTVTVNFTLS